LAGTILNVPPHLQHAIINSYINFELNICHSMPSKHLLSSFNNLESATKDLYLLPSGASVIGAMTS